MLTFFRRIRKGLLDSSQARKYLLYAMGEIALVVIGILIALQINNWNELNKEAEFELKVLKEIDVGLNREINQLKNGIRWNDQAIFSCNTILNHMKQGLPYNDSLDRHFSYSLQWWYPTLTNNAYESLKTHGLHLIKNDSIRDALGSIYEYKYPEVLSNRQDEYFFNTVSPLITDLFDSNEFRGNMKPYDYDRLRTSLEYAHILRTLISNRNWQNGTFKEWLRIRKNLSAMITVELNKK